MRWQHPVRGLVPPDEFVPLAERTGLVHRLTAFVLREALDQVAEWWAHGIQVPVAVNVSMRDLQETDLAGLVAAELDAHHLPPTALVLEVTESVLAQDPGRAVATLRELADLGVSSSLDDFGTGYSSLLLLERLPVAEIKIDRSFVRARWTRPTATRRWSARSSASPTASGSRSWPRASSRPGAWKLLRDMGCDVAQGYRVARPMPAAQATQWLVERVVRGPAERTGLRVVGGDDAAPALSAPRTPASRRARRRPDATRARTAAGP